MRRSGSPHPGFLFYIPHSETRHAFPHPACSGTRQRLHCRGRSAPMTRSADAEYPSPSQHRGLSTSGSAPHTKRASQQFIFQELELTLATTQWSYICTWMSSWPSWLLRQPEQRAPLASQLVQKKLQPVVLRLIAGSSLVECSLRLIAGPSVVGCSGHASKNFVASILRSHAGGARSASD